ncbi:MULTISPECIES: hypothetical protein [unclassified Moorena]|uniref:hypothetical protein n=1 Tax=unclassified Moorena TaxID=2683338 RepID=UPI0025DBEA9D|nr:MULTISPECIES: hypothetical protein [unclassified Moorena]
MRFDIEENFLDDQSNGTECAKVRNSLRLSSITIMVYPGSGHSFASQPLGVEVVETGKRRWDYTHWFRGNSYFRIGIDWVKSYEREWLETDSSSPFHQ